LPTFLLQVSVTDTLRMPSSIVGAVQRAMMLLGWVRNREPGENK